MLDKYKYFVYGFKCNGVLWCMNFVFELGG